MTGTDLALFYLFLVCDSRPQEEASSNNQTYSRHRLERSKGDTAVRKAAQNSRTTGSTVQDSTRRHPVRTEDRMPVEVAAKERVRLGFYLPSEVLPGVDPVRRISEIMGQAA